MITRPDLRFVCCLCAVLLIGCSTIQRQKLPEEMDAPDSGAWVCEAFLPIRPSAGDSVKTQVQIAEHNAAWQAICDTQN